MDKLTSIGAGTNAVVKGEFTNRVEAASGVISEGLAYLKWKHVLIFPTTWLLFFFLGKWFFENVLGRYHATSSRYWALACKLIFLVTFIASGNLLNLMIAEVYGFMHPTLRTVAWTSTLTLLCFLLNNVIPFLAVTSMCRTLGLPRGIAGSLGMGAIIVSQIWFWFIGETFISDKSETWHDHHSVSIIFFLYQQLFLKDLEHSVAIIAMMGTFISAIISGFATVSFPMDSLMIFRGVNTKLLNTKERTHIEVLSQIAQRKMNLLISLSYEKDQENNNDNTFTTAGSFSPKSSDNQLSSLNETIGSDDLTLSETNSPGRKNGVMSHRPNRVTTTNNNSKAVSKKKSGGVRASISLTLGKITKASGKQEYRELFKDLSRTNSYLNIFYYRVVTMMSNLWNNIDSFVDHIIINSRNMWARQGYQSYQRPKEVIPSLDIRMLTTVDRNRILANEEVTTLEQIAQDIFLDIVHSHELREQAEFAKTKMGLCIWYVGIFLSFVGVVRLFFALYHVSKGFVLSFTEKEKIAEEDETYFADIFMAVFGMSKNEWDLTANLIVIFLLGAFQVRAFLGSMMISARLGFLSTNTELYALVLAYLAGFYFIASVVLCRIQLPIEYRKGVTVALGQFSFDYFEWLFDRMYITSSAASLFYLWQDARRKKAASQRFFHQ
jgi:hypothetical protein